MQVKVNNEAERLMAEQAVLGYREVAAAREAAASGEGMAAIEDAVLDVGRRQMRSMIEQASRSQAESQKGGRVARCAASEPRSNDGRSRR